MNPVGGNSVGFRPSNLPTPQDAFVATHGVNAQIDEGDYARLLESMGLSGYRFDYKAGPMWRKYAIDADKTLIDLKGFIKVFTGMCDLRRELRSRGYSVSKRDMLLPWRVSFCAHACVTRHAFWRACRHKMSSLCL